jgi:hypothetical protein
VRRCHNKLRLWVQQVPPTAFSSLLSPCSVPASSYPYTYTSYQPSPQAQLPHLGLRRRLLRRPTPGNFTSLSRTIPATRFSKLTPLAPTGSSNLIVWITRVHRSHPGHHCVFRILARCIQRKRTRPARILSRDSYLGWCSSLGEIRSSILSDP